MEFTTRLHRQEYISQLQLRLVDEPALGSTVSPGEKVTAWCQDAGRARRVPPRGPRLLDGPLEQTRQRTSVMTQSQLTVQVDDYEKRDHKTWEERFEDILHFLICSFCDQTLSSCFVKTNQSGVNFLPAVPIPALGFQPVTWETNHTPLPLIYRAPPSPLPSPARSPSYEQKAPAGVQGADLLLGGFVLSPACPGRDKLNWAALKAGWAGTGREGAELERKRDRWRWRWMTTNCWTGLPLATECPLAPMRSLSEWSCFSLGLFPDTLSDMSQHCSSRSLAPLLSYPKPAG
ncbi:unnamed protein product [Arctogadus glacialis]